MWIIRRKDMGIINIILINYNFKILKIYGIIMRLKEDF